MSSSAATSTPDTVRLAPLGPVQKVRLVVEILMAYPMAWRLVRGNSLPSMVATARNVRPVPHGLAAELERTLALRLGVAVTRTLRFVPMDSRCLVRSVVLSRLLARRGIPGSLVIGVTPGQEFAAHAWVEHKGRPVSPRGRHERLMEI
jgi:hypothetical protein